MKLITDIYAQIKIDTDHDDTALGAVIGEYLDDQDLSQTIEEWRIENYVLLRQWAYPEPVDLNSAYVKLNSGVSAEIVNGQSELDNYYTKCLVVRERFPGTIVVIETVAALRERLKKIVNTERKNRLNAGFAVNGVNYAFDINARIAYQEMALVFSMSPGFSTDWKADTEWVVLDLALYQQVVAVGMVHVQTCFDWQKTKEIELDGCITIEELNLVELT